MIHVEAQARPPLRSPLTLTGSFPARPRPWPARGASSKKRLMLTSSLIPGAASSGPWTPLPYRTNAFLHSLTSAVHLLQPGRARLRYVGLATVKVVVRFRVERKNWSPLSGSVVPAPVRTWRTRRGGRSGRGKGRGRTRIVGRCCGGSTPPASSLVVEFPTRHTPLHWCWAPPHWSGSGGWTSGARGARGGRRSGEKAGSQDP